MKHTYIQKDTESIYVEFEQKLGKEIETGALWEDYVAGLWVLLTKEQVAFRDEHPKASVSEMLKMQLTPPPEPPSPPERTLEEAIRDRIAGIDLYDTETVNRVIVNTGEAVINCWFDAQQRATYQTSISARRKLIAAGIITDSTIQLPVAGQLLSLPLDAAEIMLARLQCYADEAFVITEMHRAAVRQLDSIEAVDSYNYATGYPEHLTFTL
jgi:hypothetical protein